MLAAVHASHTSAVQKPQAFRGMVYTSRGKKHCSKAGGKEPCFATRAASCCRKARAHADWVSGEEQLVNPISPVQTRLLHGRWLWKNMSVGGGGEREEEIGVDLPQA